MAGLRVGVEDGLSSLFESGFGVTRGEQAIVSDFDEAFGKDVQQEALYEFMCAEGDESM